MDSQQAAFEKFKASGTGRKFPREQRNAGGMPSAMDGPVPDLYSIHHGKIVRVEDFGAFVQLPGFRKHGLVHKTQLSNHFVEHVADVVAVGDNVWVKVTSIQDDKIALSMKYVNQGEGRDLDPNLVQLSETEDKRRVHTGFVDRGPISIEEGGVLLKTVCKKCGAAGHLAAECFSGGERFELLRDDDDSDVQDRQTTRGEGRGRSSGKEKKKKDKNEDRDGGRGRRDKDKDKSRYREKDGHNRDRKERNEPSSGHRKEKRRDRSRSSSPRRDSDQQKTTKVESLEDALAVMRAHKHRRRTRDSEDEEGDGERRERKRSGHRKRSRSPRTRSRTRSRSRSPKRREDRREKERERRERDNHGNSSSNRHGHGYSSHRR